jgi:hypothetical protein
MRLENYSLALRVPKDRPANLARWGELEEGREMVARLVTPDIVGPLQFDDNIPYIPLARTIMPEETRRTKAGKWAIPAPINKVSLFTFTAKMGCASFSLAAGPSDIHGTCHASNLTEEKFRRYSQEAVDDGHFADLEAAKTGWRVEGDRKSIPISEVGGMFICDACYAGKGNYAYDSMAFYMAIKKVWVERALGIAFAPTDKPGKFRKVHSSAPTFADEMERAVRHVLGNDRLMVAQLAVGDHFRIHDSGDWYSPAAEGGSKFAYFDGWVEVVRRMQDVRFWAPTRMWVFKDWRDHMIATTQGLSNFAMRPSALVYGSKAPMVRGIAMGSTSSDVPIKPFTDPMTGMEVKTWECPAYKSVEGSCTGSCCRTCWDRPDVPVSYHTH